MQHCGGRVDVSVGAAAVGVTVTAMMFTPASNDVTAMAWTLPSAAVPRLDDGCNRATSTPLMNTVVSDGGNGQRHGCGR